MKEIFGAEQTDAIRTYAAALGDFLRTVGVGEYGDVDAIVCIGGVKGVREGEYPRGEIFLACAAIRFSSVGSMSMIKRP